MDCSPRWADTTIHQLAYSREGPEVGKLVRKALFRVLKYAPSHFLLCVTPPHVGYPADGTGQNLGNPSTSTGTSAS